MATWLQPGCTLALYQYLEVSLALLSSIRHWLIIVALRKAVSLWISGTVSFKGMKSFAHGSIINTIDSYDTVISNISTLLMHALITTSIKNIKYKIFAICWNSGYHATATYCKTYRYKYVYPNQWFDHQDMSRNN